MDAYNVKIINDIISNETSHVVAVFKDYLLYDDINDFLKKRYRKNDISKRLSSITSYYCKYCTVFPNYINLEEKKYLYKNIIRKQKMLNEKHEDIMKIKCKQQIEIIKYKNYDSSMFSNASRLFTSGYLYELEHDPSYARILEAGSEANDSRVALKSQYLNFNWHDRSSSCIELQNKQNNDWPVRDLNDILHSILMKESENSISNTINWSEADKLFHDDSFNNKNSTKVKSDNFMSNQVVKKNLPMNHAKSPCISEFTASRNIQIWSKTKINQKNCYRTAYNKDESVTSTCRNSNDIKEHPSIDESKQEKYPTKDKYQKYLGKRRSASKGVFNYLDYDKPSTPTPTNVLKDIQNNLISPKIFSAAQNVNLDWENAQINKTENSWNIKQNARHIRTKTLMSTDITEDGL